MKKFMSLGMALVLILGLMCVPASAMSIESSPTGNVADIRDIIAANYQAVEPSMTTISAEVQETILSDSPTNGEGRIDHVIVLDADIMPLISYTDIEVPANSVIYFTSAYLTTITMSVDYKPSNLTLYYGISKNNDGTGNHWANSATGGSGSATITPGSSRTYYLYLANGNDKVMYVDVDYTAIGKLSLD